MDPLPAPVITPLAQAWLEGHWQSADLPQRVLFQTIDGHRNVVELESLARALGLRPDALEVYRQAGLIRFQ
jgi:hypothetical protein